MTEHNFMAGATSHSDPQGEEHHRLQMEQGDNGEGGRGRSASSISLLWHKSTVA